MSLYDADCLAGRFIGAAPSPATSLINVHRGNTVVLECHLIEDFPKQPQWYYVVSVLPSAVPPIVRDDIDVVCEID